MKTLIDLNVEPCVGMVVKSFSGRHKQHIMEISNRFSHYDKNNKAVYKKHVFVLNEQGHSNWVEYEHFINRYCFVTMSNYRLEDLFKSTDFDVARINKVKELINQIEKCF